MKRARNRRHLKIKRLIKLLRKTQERVCLASAAGSSTYKLKMKSFQSAECKKNVKGLAEVMMLKLREAAPKVAFVKACWTRPDNVFNVEQLWKACALRCAHLLHLH